MSTRPLLGLWQLRHVSGEDWPSPLANLRGMIDREMTCASSISILTRPLASADPPVHDREMVRWPPASGQGGLVHQWIMPHDDKGYLFQTHLNWYGGPRFSGSHIHTQPSFTRTCFWQHASSLLKRIEDPSVQNYPKWVASDWMEAPCQHPAHGCGFPAAGCRLPASSSRAGQCLKLLPGQSTLPDVDSMPYHTTIILHMTQPSSHWWDPIFFPIGPIPWTQVRNCLHAYTWIWCFPSHSDQWPPSMVTLAQTF